MAAWSEMVPIPKRNERENWNQMRAQGEMVPIPEQKAKMDPNGGTP